MRFEQIDLTAYGNFTDRTLKFTDPSKTVHVIYGPNEAGKSTLKNAIEELLFGYHARTPYDFKHPYATMVLGATLVSAVGDRVTFIRRKKKSGSDLFTAANDPMPASALAPFVGGLTRETYQDQFCLSRQSFIDGSTAIANGSGEVGESLYNAATGNANVPEIVSRLERLSQELFAPNARNRKLNVAIGAYDDQRRVAREAMVRPEAWQKLVAERDQILADLAELNLRIGAATSAKTTLTALLACAPDYALLRTSRIALEAAADEPRMDPNAVETAAKLLTKLEALERDVARGQLRLARIDETIGPDIVNLLLEQSLRIDGLMSVVGNYRKGVVDLKELDLHGYAVRSAEEAQTFLDSVWKGVEVAEARKRVVPADAQQRGNALVVEIVKFNANVDADATKARELVDEVDAVTAQLEQFPAPVNLDLLRGPAAAALAESRLDAEVDQAERYVASTNKAATGALAALGRFSGSLADLVVAALPLGATIERHFTAIDGTRVRKERVLERMEEARNDRDGASQELDAMSRQSAIRTLADLTSARSERDARFDALAEQWRAGAESPELDSSADEYRPSVAEADAVADLLRTDAARVAQVAELEARRDAALSESERLQAELLRIDQDAVNAQTAWEAEWLPLDVIPLSPAEMRPWLLDAHEVRRLTGEAHAAEIKRDELSTRRSSLRVALAGALASLEIEVPIGVTLGPVLDIANRTLSKNDGIEADRARLVDEKTRLDREMLKVAGDRKRAEAALAETTAAFRAILESLFLPSDLAPAAFADTLTAIASFRTADKKARDNKGRADGIDRDNAKFRNDVLSFVEVHVPALKTAAESAPDFAVEKLHELLVAAQKSSAERNARIEQRDAEQMLLADDIDAQRFILADLDVILTRERISRDALAGRLERSRILNDHGSVFSIKAAHIELVTGKTLAECDQEYGDRDRDALQLGISIAEGEIGTLSGERDRLNERLWQVKEELGRLDGSSAAADAEAQLASLGTAVDQGARQWLELTLAAHVLKEQIRKYSESNQGAVISRASHYLSVLTDGRYTKLNAVADGDRNVLVAVNADGAGLEISSLSEGTRDQLFLALRLAALETYLAQAEPQPLILDDTFIAYDDERTTHAFKALAEIASRTQVIYFTHHGACVEAARAGVGDDRLAVHLLNEAEADGLALATT